MNKYKGNELRIFPDSYVLLDIETTGLKPTEAEITEIAAYKVVDNKVVDTFSSLIKINNPVPPIITEITHITDDMLKDQEPIEVVLKNFKEFLGDNIIMGHNVPFDIGFLTHYSFTCFGNYILNDYVDTLTIARKVLKNTVVNHKLQTLSEYYGLDIEGEHRALKDVDLTFQVYNKLRELHDERIESI